MRRFGMVMVILALLTACGGGSSKEDKSLFPTTPIQTNATINGNLSSSDVQVPDGTYTDLYTITVDSPTLLNIRLESSAFDVFLFLFDGAVLAIPDLNEWDPYLLAYNDDIDDQTTDAGLTYQLSPGMYVIAVNNLEPGILGAYTLKTTTSQVIISGRFLQYRVYENPANNRILGWIQFRDNGNNIQASQILYAQIFFPDGTELFPVSPMQFRSANFVLGTWNPFISRFDQIVPYGDSGYVFDLSNYSFLPAGIYTFTAMPAAGEPLFSQAPIPSLPLLNPIQVVRAASMVSEWKPDGSLQLSWTEPENPSDDYRMIFTLANTNTTIFHGIVRGANQVILQPSLVQQIAQSAGISLPTTVQWVIQTRNISNGINYERGYSDPVTISW
jgi:hypothetical protein